MRSLEDAHGRVWEFYAELVEFRDTVLPQTQLLEYGSEVFGHLTWADSLDNCLELIPDVAGSGSLLFEERRCI